MFPSGENPTSFGSKILNNKDIAIPCGMASKWVFDGNNYVDLIIHIFLIFQANFHELY